MSSRIRSLNFTGIALLAGLAVLPLQIRAAAIPVAPAYSVSPNPAPADKAFTLYLYGVPLGCNTTFSHETVSVSGKRIDLGFVAKQVIYGVPGTAQDPASDIVCPVYDQPQAAMPILPPLYPLPTYSMPALAAGTYEVWVTQGQECQYSTPACMIKVAPVSAGTLTVQPDGAITYSISPTKAAAGKAFDLSLLSYQFNCATTFDNLSTAVSGNTLTLTFLDRQKVGVLCPAIYAAYGPTYKMNALKAGTYKVMAYRLPACYPCKMAGETTEAGTLVIGADTARSGWFLKDKETLAAKPFTMQLLNNDVGNCGVTFTHKTVTTTGGAIHTSFVLEVADVRCIVDIHPNGPSFDMAGLAKGAYPVYVEQLALCEVQAPYCGIARPPVLIPSDTLIVTETAATLLSELRRSSPAVEWQGSRAAFQLPKDGGRGIWKAELLTLSGRRLAVTSLTGEGGRRAEAEWGLKPERGVYLLRLIAPGGESHLLPFTLNRR